MSDRPALRAMIEWLTPSADRRRLEQWQRWHGAVMLGYLVVRAPVLLDRPSRWEPVGVLGATTDAFDESTLFALWAAAVGASVALVVGRLRRLGSIGLAIAALLLLTHRSSGGQILWFDVLLVLHSLVLGVTAAVQPRSKPDDRTTGWGLRLAGLVTVVAYVLAGIAKFRIGGIEWISDGILERHISYSAMRLDALGGTASPLASPLVDLSVASTPLAVGVIAIELGAPIALVNRRLAFAWSATAWLMHLVIAATMFVIFHWPLFGAAFLPLLLVQDSPAARRSA